MSAQGRGAIVVGRGRYITHLASCPDGTAVTAELVIGVLRTARCCRAGQTCSGVHLLAAEDPLPDGLPDALTLITGRATAR